MERNVARMKGYIRAVADQKHPLQKKLRLILTDFEPNHNNQGIPPTERNNIIASALYMPLKINFDGEDYSGHAGALPVGPITNVFEAVDNGRTVIMGDAVIWTELYQDVSEYLLDTFEEGIGTSWEIYFEKAEKDSSGVEWLHGCVFAGTCIVDTPAYGPNRTRVLAIAEKLKEKESNNLGENITMPPEEQEVAAQAESLDDTRENIISAEDLLMQLWSGLEGLYNTTFEIEQAQVENNIASIAENFADLIGKIASKLASFKSEAELYNKAKLDLDNALAELEVFKKEKAEAEQRAARAEKLSVRRKAIVDAGIDMSEDAWVSREDFYLNMSDDIFSTYINDISLIAQKSAKAELKTPKIPEPLNGDMQLTTKELAAQIIALSKQ